MDLRTALQAHPFNYTVTLVKPNGQQLQQVVDYIEVRHTIVVYTHCNVLYVHCTVFIYHVRTRFR